MATLVNRTTGAGRHAVTFEAGVLACNGRTYPVGANAARVAEAVSGRGREIVQPVLLADGRLRIDAQFGEVVGTFTPRLASPPAPLSTPAPIDSEAPPAPAAPIFPEHPRRRRG